MTYGDAYGVFLGAVVLGAVHGIEPGHGWPVAASYALDRTNKWVYGLAASLIIGIGHLFSSLLMVAVFFYAKAQFDLLQVNEPVSVAGGVQLGGPVSIVAGVLLILLGVREYSHGHSHGRPGESRGDHAHDDNHDHGHAHDDNHDPGRADVSTGGLWTRLRAVVPFVGGHSHSHDGFDDASERGLLGIAWFAFVLGFAHEEEFEIIAMCAGSNYCLELMSVYAVTVVVGIVGLTLALIAGYEHFEAEVAQYTPYLPVFSAAVLVLMGVGFVTGLF